MSLIGPDIYFDLFPSEVLSESERIIRDYKALHPGWEPEQDRNESYNYTFPFTPQSPRSESFEDRTLR